MRCKVILRRVKRHSDNARAAVLKTAPMDFYRDRLNPSAFRLSRFHPAIRTGIHHQRYPDNPPVKGIEPDYRGLASLNKEPAIPEIRFAGYGSLNGLEKL